MLSENILKSFAPFAGLNDAFLSEAIRCIHVTKAKKGTIIFKRGKELADKFFLLEGEVHLINNEFGSEKVAGGEERSKYALNVSSPTQVSAIAKTSITYFTINASDLDHYTKGRLAPPVLNDEVSAEDSLDIQVMDVSDQKDWMSCLLQSPLFNRIPTSQLQELFTKFETLEVKKGDCLVKEGAKGDYFYVLASGRAEISDRTGATHVRLKEGQYFGEEALISQAPRNASVTMLTDGLVKRLSCDDFTHLVKRPVLQYLDAKALSGIERPYKVLDVRLPIEYRANHLPGSINVPLSKLRTTLTELAHNNAYLVSSEGGSRADIAAYLLCQAGFDAFVLKGELSDTSEAV